MRKLRVLLAFAFFAFSVARVDAESILLMDLIDGDGSIVHGDKLFDNFGLEVVDTIGLGFPAIGTIVVEGITRNGEHGLRFTGSLSATGQPEGPSGFGIVLNYSVTSLDPKFLIHDLTIASGVTVQNGGVLLTEQAFGPDSLLLADASASAGGVFPTDPSVTEIIDHQEFGGDVSSIDVRSAFSLFGARTQFCSPCGSASISYIDQTFSQTQVVPEPGTFVLLCIGFAAVRCARLRRSHVA
jgi:hypothetical protein